LTIGKPAVTDFIKSNDMTEDDALALIAAVESGSEHPLADAIVRYAEEKNVTRPTIQDFQSESGLGVRAQVSGKEVLVGNGRFLSENNIDIGSLEIHTEMLESQAKTTVYAAADGKAIALLAISDTLKSSSASTIKTLRDEGIAVWMITGDKKRTADAIGKKLGIDSILSEVLPGEKADKVKSLQGEGRIVAFVGDGVNDAPALAQADVGIALGSGTDVSVETGDIVLVRNDLSDVVSGIDLGRKTVSKIRQGFFWALIYNMILLPIAAGVFYPFTGIALRPEFAGLAMALSSVSVVTNALLLGRFKPREIDTDSIAESEMHEVPAIAIDPICKMDVDTVTATLVSEYNGKMYYFCNPYCKDTFDANPEEYKDKDFRD